MTDKGAVHQPLELLTTLALTLAVYLLAQANALTNPFVINDDVRQQIYWMQQWQDPSLYQDNVLNAYARQYVPWGIKIIYRAAAFAIDPLLFSKILTGAIFACLGTLVFMTGRALLSRSLGWACLAVFWTMPYFLFTISGGLARSFAFPLVLLFLLGWFHRKPWIATVSLVLQSFLIPYVFCLCLAATSVSWLLHKIGRAGSCVIPLSVWHAAATAAGIAAVTIMKHSFDAAGFGPMVTRADIASNPIFSANGRYEIGTTPAFLQDLIVTPWEYIGAFHELGTAGGIVSVAVIIIAGIFCIRFADFRAMRPFAAPVFIFAGTSVALYLAAYVVILKLFLPDRYILYTVNLAYCILMGIAFHAAWVRYGSSRCAAITLVSVAFALGILRLHNVGVYDFSGDKDLCEAVSRTPKTALIAAHPRTADNILTFGKRNVPASFELAHPWAKGYWRLVEPRISAFFTAYYASNAQPVLDFCRRYRVDFIAVDDRHFAREFIAGRPFMAPFDRQIREIAEGTTRFYLASSNTFDSIAVNSHQRLIDVRSLEAAVISSDTKDKKTLMMDDK